MKREERYKKKMQAAGLIADNGQSPVSIRESDFLDPTPRKNDQVRNSQNSFDKLVKTFSTDPIYMQEMPEKKVVKPHYKFLSPKKDKFSKRNRTLDSNKKADILLRQSNTKQYS